MAKFQVSPVIVFLFVLLSFAVSFASEPPRLFKTMPTGAALSGPAFKTSKKSAWICTAVKIGPKGNWNAVSGAQAKIFATVPETDAAAEEGTKAIRCNLKIYDLQKHKTTNADLDDSNA